MKKAFIYLSIIFIVPLLTACPFLFEDNIDPVLKEQHDAYVDVYEYHQTKQMLVLEFYSVFTDGFSTELYAKRPETDQLENFWIIAEEFYKYSLFLDSARLALIETYNISSSNDYLLKSAMGGEFDWLFSKSKFFNGFIEQRNEFQQYYESLNSADQESLFKELKQASCVVGSGDHSDFYYNLVLGDYDYACGRYDTVLEDQNENYQKWKEDNNKSTSIQKIHKTGVAAVEEAPKVIVTGVKHSNPVLNKFVDGAEKVKEFIDWFDKSDKKTKDQRNVEIIENLNGSIPEAANASVDIDKQVENTINVAELLAKSYKMNNEPTSAVVDASNIDWGGLVLENEDSNEPDIVLAQRSINEEGHFPYIMLLKDLVSNSYTEWVAALPKGDWNIITIDKKGQADTTVNFPIMPANFGTLPFSFEGKDSIVDEIIEGEENIDGGANPDPGIDFSRYKYVKAQLNWCDPADYSYLKVYNVQEYSETNLFPLEWNGNRFSVSFEHEGYQTTQETSVSISGGIVEDENGILFVEGTFYKEYKNTSTGQIFTKKIELIKVPFDNYYGSSDNRENQMQFKISKNVNEKYFENFFDYASYEEGCTGCNPDYLYRNRFFCPDYAKVYVIFEDENPFEN